MTAEEELNWTNELSPLLNLPILVQEKVLSFITNPFDIKAVRLSSKELKAIIDKNSETLNNLQLIISNLSDLENLVSNNDDRIYWSNVKFPPELNRVGSRRHYVEKFNNLLECFTDYAFKIRKLDLSHLNLSNQNYVNLLVSCGNLKHLRVDTITVNGMKESELAEILQDDRIISVLENLKHLDVTAFEFLTHDFQFAFMGNMLEKCRNLESLSSWGYFPEWEQPASGTTHLKFFIWPLLTYLRTKFEIVDLMLQNVQSPGELGQFNFQYLNESMDWQSSKWILDLKNTSSDCSSLETFLFSRITSYVHRAVGWFDEGDYRKSGLSLMKNLKTVRIHNARDITLTGENPYQGELFPLLEDLTLIVGNRTPCSEEENVLLEKVIVQMFLNRKRSTVQTLNLDIDLDHHHQLGHINLPEVIQNFPSLVTFCVEEWGPNDVQLETIFDAFPMLRSLMFCGRNATDLGILGRSQEEKGKVELNCGIRKLYHLQVLKILSVRLPPKNVFPWLMKENNNITDASFHQALSKMRLRKFHFLLKSLSVTIAGLDSLQRGEFSTSAAEFVMNWLPEGVDSSEKFRQLHKSFRFLDPQTFLEPANFVIPDIGRWVL